MSKTKIDAVKFEAIILESGLPSLHQKGFVKVQGAKGRQVYVASTKTVGRTDISGFEVQMEGVTDLKGESFGNVHQQLDFSRTEEEILATFRAILAHMATLGPVERKAKQPGRAPRPAAQGWTGKVPQPSKAERLALIKKVAQEKGVKVSKEAGEELGAS